MADIKDTEEKQDIEESNVDDSDGLTLEKKTSKAKAPYVLTEARKNSFDKARLKRQENIEMRKLEKEKDEKIIVEYKKKEYKLKKNIPPPIYSSSEEEEEIIEYRKKKKNKIKKTVIYMDSDDEEDEVVIQKRPLPIQKRVIQFI